MGLPGSHRDRDRRGGTAAETSCLEHLTSLLLPIAGAEASAHARALLDRWPTLAGVLAVSEAAAAQVVPNAVVRQLAVLRAAMLHSLRTDLLDRPLLGSTKAVQAYLASAMAHDTVEQVRMLLLDARLHLIDDVVLSSGTAHEAPLYPREIARRCFDVGAVGLILAHNHPSGNCEPSSHDIAATTRLAATLAGLEISLHDHVIVAATGAMSMRARGLL